jgi:hypothetical protein
MDTTTYESNQVDYSSGRKGGYYGRVKYVNPSIVSHDIGKSARFLVEQRERALNIIVLFFPHTRQGEAVMVRTQA